MLVERFAQEAARYTRLADEATTRTVREQLLAKARQYREIALGQRPIERFEDYDIGVRIGTD